MADLGAVHARLREILAPFGDDLVITKDGPCIPQFRTMAQELAQSRAR